VLVITTFTPTDFDRELQVIPGEEAIH
jgi:hypothetical protein